MPDLNVASTLRQIVATKPLIHHITNWVTIYPCAQITRSWGALPVMAHAEEEVAEMASLASALVLNIGTLTSDLLRSMEKAAGAAGKKGIPVVLDAVGAGATQMRTEACRKFLEAGQVSILKGNAGEIATLAGIQAEVRGVESISSAGDIGNSAKKLAGQFHIVVAVTGKTDVVTDGSRLWTLAYGHPLMGRVVGTGCVSTSTVGCFVAMGVDRMEKTAQALAAYGLAGERTAASLQEPGRFWEVFADEISGLSSKPDILVLQAKEI